MYHTRACHRCDAPAYAVLKIEATIGQTQLTVSGEGGAIALCALCMLELKDFFEPSARPCLTRRPLATCHRS